MLIKVATCLLDWRVASHALKLARLGDAHCASSQMPLHHATHVVRRPITEHQGRVVIHSAFVHHLTADLVWVPHQLLFHLEATFWHRL